LTFVKVAQRGEIKENSGKELYINGTRIALFYANGKYYAIEVVECPLHSWHYNIRTGELLDYLEGVKLMTYNVEVRGNDIYIDA
jgi:nitrite reductase/ring-hydroxylating ferredoxin subunit